MEPGCLARSLGHKFHCWFSRFERPGRVSAYIADPQQREARSHTPGLSRHFHDPVHRKRGAPDRCCSLSIFSGSPGAHTRIRTSPSMGCAFENEAHRAHLTKPRTAALARLMCRRVMSHTAHEPRTPCGGGGETQLSALLSSRRGLSYMGARVS